MRCATLLRTLPLLCLLLLSTCSKPTFVTLAFDGDAALLTGVTRLELLLELAGRSQQTQVQPGGVISFPAKVNLEIGGGEGTLQVVASALDAAGGERARGSGAVAVQGGEIRELALRLTAPPTDALLSADATSLDLGVVNAGMSSNRQLLVTNSGAKATGPLAVQLPAGAPFSQINNCEGTALAAGGRCTVQVLYQPTRWGTSEATLTVSAAPGGSLQIPLRGVGRDTVRLSGSVVGYGRVLLPAGLSGATRECNYNSPSCSETYERTISEPQFTLQAVPAGHIFLSWMGCDSVSGTACTVKLSQDRSVTATFIYQGDMAPGPVDLAVIRDLSIVH